MALVNEWLDSRAGAEVLFEQMAGAFPRADLYVLTARTRASFDFGGRTVRTTPLDRVPVLRHRRAIQFPLMPVAWKAIRRPGYDVVVTSTHAFGREFVRPKDAVHCNYVQAPMRYVWSPQIDDRATGWGGLGRIARSLARRRDLASVDSVTSFAGNSNAVVERIETYYGRAARVLHPPVDTDYFEAATRRDQGYLLAASRWIPYKRLDLAIGVAACLDLPLVIAGSGPMESALRNTAARLHPGGVDFRIQPTRQELRSLMGGASAFLFPANEDFGIIAVEAQAAGCPVIGLAAGGSLDTVVDGLTGTLAQEQTVESLTEAAERCLLKQLPADQCRTNARRFGHERFRRELRQWVADAAR